MKSLGSSWLVKAGAAAVVLALALLFGGKRDSGAILEASREPPCLVRSAWMSEYHFKPNCTGEGYAGAHHAPMTFNSAGLRDREYAPRPPKGATRILLLGASNVLGIGLPERATLARLLEAELSTRAGHKVEVINGATNGYCTWQTAFRFREMVRRFNPHFVLYNVGKPNCFMSDLAWEPRVVWSTEGDPRGFDRSAFGVGAVPAWINTIYFDPGVFPLMHTLHDSFRRLKAYWGIRLFHSANPEEALEAGTNRALQYLDKAATEEKARFFAFTYPSDEPAQGQYIPFGMYPRLARFLAAFQPKLESSSTAQIRELLRSGVPFIYLTKYSPRALPDDAHLTEESTVDWSRQLAEAVIQKGLLRPGKTGDGKP